MEVGGHTFLLLEDGVAFVQRDPSNPSEPPTPAGTHVTVSQNDSAGRPMLTVFIPQIWHPTRPADDVAVMLRGLALSGEPRPQTPGSPLCNVCARFGAWITSSLRAGKWLPFSSAVRTVTRHSCDFEHVFIMGYLEEVMRTPGCSLCELVTKALEECFGGRFKVPLSYETRKGTFSQQVALHCYSLTAGGGEEGPELVISLSSSDSLVLPMTWLRNNHIGLKYRPSIVLLGEDAAKLPTKISIGTETAKVMDRNGADLSIALECYRVCKETHRAICEEKRGTPGWSKIDARMTSKYHQNTRRPEIPNLLLLDIEDMRITLGPLGCEYFALSYVWGQGAFIKLTSENEEQLRQKGGLQLDNLPQVFKDAMEVTRLFGGRYLWIDALCIVQDDAARRNEQVMQMDDIFGHASLTILAASGSGAASGLAGLRPGTRKYMQTIRDIGGLRFAAMPPPLHRLLELDGEAWGSRGWTYQEAMLSKRVLIFATRQVYYICNLVSCSEDVHFVPGRKIPKEGASDLQNHPLYRVSRWHYLSERRDFALRQHWFSYGPLVEDFSRRHFTYESDVLQSLVGVLKTMTDSRMERYICAMPTSLFEWALLWQPKGPVRRRACATSGHPFPSWSWIGWVGATKLPEYWFSPSSMIPVINSWMFLTPMPGIPREGSSAQAAGYPREYTRDEVYRTLLPYRPEAHPIEQEMPFQPTRWQVWDKISARLGTNNPYFKEDPGGFIKRIPTHRSEVTAVYPLIESGVLDFEADSATFSIDRTPLNYTYKGFDREVTACFKIKHGELWGGTIMFPRTTAGELLKTESTEAEFILISETYWTYEDPPIPGSSGPDFGKYTFDTVALDHVDIPNQKLIMGNVMWIRRKDGLAFRVGLGQIHLDVWKRANPKKKGVLLV